MGQMNKKYLAWVVAIVIVLALLEIALAITVTREHGEIREIPLIEAVVVNLDYEKDLVTIKDAEGHLWQFAECEDWLVGDYVKITPIYTGYEK